MADNGAGFGIGIDVGRKGAHGLGNMRDRATSIGGTITFSDAGPGACVRVHIPIVQEDFDAS